MLSIRICQSVINRITKLDILAARNYTNKKNVILNNADLYKKLANTLRNGIEIKHIVGHMSVGKRNHQASIFSSIDILVRNRLPRNYQKN